MGAVVVFLALLGGARRPGKYRFFGGKKVTKTVKQPRAEPTLPTRPTAAALHALN